MIHRKKIKTSNICDVCNKIFKISDTLKSRMKKHMLRIHSEERPQKCKDCHKTFPLLSSLRTHTLIHDGESQYQCNQCGKNCVDKNRLNMHLKRHSGEKPLKCSECDLRFLQKGSLERHIRVVHGQTRDYKCNECEKTFVTLIWDYSALKN